MEDSLAFEKTLVPNPRPTAHGCNPFELPDGRILLMWYAGSFEGAEDQRILMSIGDGGANWSEPQVLVDHFHYEGDGWIPEIAAFLVDDEGQAWVVFAAAPLSGFFMRRGQWRRELDLCLLFQARVDMSSRTCAQPELISERRALILQGKNVRLADGRWLVQCLAYDAKERYCSTLMVGDPTSGWEMLPDLECEPGCLEPSTVQMPDGALICYMRYAGQGGHVWRSDSPAGPIAFCSPYQTALRNPHSGIDAASDGESLVLAFNDSYFLRTPLTLGVSEDRGRTFRTRDIEMEPGEYSYPKLLHASDGCWHVFYTWQRKCIAHARFDLDWLGAGRPAFGLMP